MVGGFHLVVGLNGRRDDTVDETGVGIHRIVFRVGVTFKEEQT